jgi:uncharacterized membrane protein
MRNIVEFFKTTALGGLFVLVPILLVYLMVSEALDLVFSMAGPIADLFPKGTFDRINFPRIMALLLILGVAFLTGLVFRLELAKWFESTMLRRLPIYNAFRGLTRGFVEGGEDGAFGTALLISPDGERTLVYVIEEHGGGPVTVLVPWAPTAFSGALKIVDRERIEFLDATLGDVSRVLSQWGVGARDLLGKRNEDPSHGSSQ